MSDVLRLSSLFVLVLLNGFFVAAEFALVSVRRTRIDQLVNENNTLARLAQRVLHDLDLYIAATQLGITMASLGIGFIAEPAIEHLAGPVFQSWNLGPEAVTTASFALAFGISTALHIVFGELAPKSLALQRAEQVSLAVAIPLLVFTTVFRPIIWALNVTGNGVVRLFGLEPSPGHHMVHSEEEIRMIVSASRDVGVLDEKKNKLLDNVFQLSDTPVRGIMTPRVEMVALDETSTLRAFLGLNDEQKYSRVPIYRGTTDTIVGIVYFGDVLEHLDALDRMPLREVARKPLFAPENMKVIDLLALFQSKKLHMAIVVDEFGGTAGVVTLEDVLEELVGEIYDEGDDEAQEQRVVKLGDDVYAFDPLIGVSTVEQVLGIDLDDELQGRYETLSGFLFHKLETIPRIGEEVEAEGWVFHVTDADERRVKQIRATRKRSNEAPAPA